MNDISVSWPNLSVFTGTTGRPATDDDVKAGSAVFILQSEGEAIGTPIDIPIPQYAYHVDQESGKKTPCVVIQAEEANGQEVVGALQVSDRSALAGLLFEFEFLGTTEPDGDQNN